MKTNWNETAQEIYKENYKWWYDKDGNKLKRNRGELLMLVVSEVSEGLEGLRKSLNDDHLPHRKMIEVELADTLIRILDFAAGFGVKISDHNNLDRQIKHSMNEASCLLAIVSSIVFMYDCDDEDSQAVRYVINQIMQHGKVFGYDIIGAMNEKRAYNQKRADHTWEAREKDGGKKF